MSSAAVPELALVSAPRHGVSGLVKDDVPTSPGLYAWWPRDGPDRPVYVGRALGAKGLRGRIWSQHLRPAAKESAFRKGVTRAHVLAPGAPTVAWITERYVVSWVTLEQLGIDADRAKRLEATLITVWRPRYNQHVGRRVVEAPPPSVR